MRKAISTYVLFIILLIAVTAMGIGVILFYFGQSSKEQATLASCQTKLTEYCYKWVKDNKEPGDWDKIPPTGCEKFNINKPTEDYCRKVYPS
jgi:hypothetical protein